MFSHFQADQYISIQCMLFLYVPLMLFHYFHKMSPTCLYIFNILDYKSLHVHTVFIMFLFMIIRFHVISLHFFAFKCISICVHYVSWYVRVFPCSSVCFLHFHYISMYFIACPNMALHFILFFIYFIPFHCKSLQFLVKCNRKLRKIVCHIDVCVQCRTYTS